MKTRDNLGLGRTPRITPRILDRERRNVGVSIAGKSRTKNIYLPRGKLETG